MRTHRRPVQLEDRLMIAAIARIPRKQSRRCLESRARVSFRRVWDGHFWMNFSYQQHGHAICSPSRKSMV